MIAFPHAKINIGLNIVKKRDDGFHNIETVFYPVELCDALEVNNSLNNKSSFFADGTAIPNDNKPNICLQALELLKKDFEIPPVNIHLLKNIPIGAGLGGGSSDATFTLKILNELFSLNISKEKLIIYASKIGSDCAFFVHDRPMLAKGRGEILSDIEIDLTGYILVLIKPPVHINTAEAFSLIKPAIPKTPIEKITRQDISTWKDELKNDFEEIIFQKHSVIKEIKEALYGKGAVYASMSGSGSSVYAIFKKKPKESFSQLFQDCFVFESINK